MNKKDIENALKKRGYKPTLHINDPQLSDERTQSKNFMIPGEERFVIYERTGRPWGESGFNVQGDFKIEDDDINKAIADALIKKDIQEGIKLKQAPAIYQDGIHVYEAHTKNPTLINATIDALIECERKHPEAIKNLASLAVNS